MRLAPLVLLASCALVLPSGGGAKEPLTALSVCGAANCGETQDPTTLVALSTLFEPAPERLGEPPPLGPYLELRGVMDGPARLGYFVPGTSVARWGWPGSEMYWVRLDEHVRAELDRVAATVTARPRPTLRSVIVNGRLVRRPAIYLALFRKLRRAPRPRASGPLWIPITFAWRSANPWAGNDSTMLYDRDDHAILRSGSWYRVPTTLRRMIVRPVLAGR
jgi:hypothetical protein